MPLSPRPSSYLPLETIHLNQNCRKFHEMDKSMKKKKKKKKIFTVWPEGGGWGGEGVGKKYT